MGTHLTAQDTPGTLGAGSKGATRAKSRGRGVGFSLVGVDHHDALYRAAGADDDGTRVIGGAECPCCKRTARRVIRVRLHDDAGWVGVCAICAGSILSTRPGSIIGGLVRPLRRRRTRNAG